GGLRTGNLADQYVPSGISKLQTLTRHRLVSASRSSRRTRQRLVLAKEDEVRRHLIKAQEDEAITSSQHRKTRRHQRVNEAPPHHSAGRRGCHLVPAQEDEASPRLPA
ncbi:hypothetical protein BHE74_00040436, partial [Ensete ventricosum]